MSSINMPYCLHLPDLRRDTEAILVWDAVTGAEGYVLEASYDGGPFAPVYRGPGEEYTKKHSDWHCNSSLLITWRWLEERSLQWHYLDDKDTSWGQMEQGLDREHKSCTVLIPSSATSVQFRICSYSGTEYSPFAESEEVTVDIPLQPMEALQHIVLFANDTIDVQINGLEAQGLSDAVLTLVYDPEFLAPADPFATSINTEILSQSPGAVKFRWVRPTDSGMAWDGLYSSLLFKAVKKGATAVSIYPGEPDDSDDDYTVIHRFSPEELDLWKGYKGSTSPEGMWDREGHRLYLDQISDGDYEFFTVVHTFGDQEINEWRGFDGEVYFEGMWDRAAQKIYR